MQSLDLARLYYDCMFAGLGKSVVVKVMIEKDFTKSLVEALRTVLNPEMHQADTDVVSCVELANKEPLPFLETVRCEVA